MGYFTICFVFCFNGGFLYFIHPPVDSPQTLSSCFRAITEVIVSFMVREAAKKAFFLVAPPPGLVAIGTFFLTLKKNYFFPLVFFLRLPLVSHY